MKDLHVRCSEEDFVRIRDRAMKLNYPSVHSYMLDRIVSDEILVEDIDGRERIIETVSRLIDSFRDHGFSKSEIPQDVKDLIRDIRQTMNEGWTAKTSVSRLIDSFRDHGFSKSEIPQDVKDLIRDIRQTMNEGWTAKTSGIDSLTQAGS